jgi:hypothetical protein
MNIDILRAEFERQHKGRNLSKHSLRGTYVSAPIAALWNQHLRTAKWVESFKVLPPERIKFDWELTALKARLNGICQDIEKVKTYMDSL